MRIMNIKEKFRESLEEGYKNYLSIHTRSSKKILPIHSKKINKNLTKAKIYGI